MRLFTWIGLSVAAGLIFAPSLTAQEGTPLFRTLRVGLTVRYQWSQKTTLETKGDWIKGSEKTRGKEKQLAVKEQTWKEVVLGVIEGEGHLLQRVYENSTAGVAKSSSTPKKVDPLRTGLHGKTLFVRSKPPSLHLHVLQGSLEGEEESELKFLEHLYGLLPVLPVKTGQSWDADGARIARCMFDGIYDPTNFSVKARCTYRGNEKVAQRACAKIQVAMTIDVSAFGEIPEVHVELAGPVFLSLDTGVILGYDLAGPIRYKARMKDGEAWIDFISEGYRTQTLRGELLEEGTDLQGGELEIPPDPR